MVSKGKLSTVVELRMRNEFQVKEAKKAVKEDDDLAEFDMDGYDDETEGPMDFCVTDSKFQQVF